MHKEKEVAEEHNYRQLEQDPLYQKLQKFKHVQGVAEMMKTLQAGGGSEQLSGTDLAKLETLRRILKEAQKSGLFEKGQTPNIEAIEERLFNRTLSKKYLEFAGLFGVPVREIEMLAITRGRTIQGVAERVDKKRIMRFKRRIATRTAFRKKQ